MANWQFKVYFGDLHRAHEAGTMSITQVTKQLADRLREILPQVKERFADDAEDLENIIDALDYVDVVDEYDDVLVELYDWGDRALDPRWNGKKLCWLDSLTSG